MEHAVPLQRLPDGLAFPTALQDRIRYDAARHRLVFRGFMRKADYDALARLSGDLPYLDALQELFSQATLATPPARSRRRVLLAAAGAVAVAAVLGGWLWQTRSAGAVPESSPETAKNVP